MRYLVAVTLGIALATPWTAAGQALPPLVRPALDVKRADGSSLKGELLAAERDSLWILAPGGDVNVVPLSALSSVRAHQRGITASGILIWSAVGGAISGLGLTVACSSVEDTSCGGVFPVTLAAWLIVGGVAAAVSGSGLRTVDLDINAIRPYARFPQGLPQGFSPTGLTSPASGPRDSLPP